MRLSTKRRRLRVDFPAFVCGDWVQLAPFFQQIDNVCPTDYINSVLTDKRSRKESSGRKCRRAGGGAARHGREEGGPRNRCNGLMIHDGGKKTSGKHPLTTRRSLSSCLAAGLSTRLKHKGDFWERFPPIRGQQVKWCGFRTVWFSAGWEREHAH